MTPERRLAIEQSITAPGALFHPRRMIGECLEEIDRLTPRWQKGEPPVLEPVWREDKVEPHIVFTLPGGRFLPFGEASEPWGTARWAPISRPA